MGSLYVSRLVVSEPMLVAAGLGLVFAESKTVSDGSELIAAEAVDWC